MRWIYIPVMFALAFGYTKMSLTDFLPRKLAIVIPKVRKPASIEEKTSLRSFRQRVSPKAFYEELLDSGKAPFDSVAGYNGVVVSDVHVENFGFIIDDSKKASYAIMDYSEVSKGIIFYDVLAHLVSSKALDKRTAWIQYFEAYKKGLKGEPHQFSFYVEKGLGNALLESERFIAENMTDDLPVKFTKLKKDHHELKVNEVTAIQKELKIKFPKIQIFEILESNDSVGNYQILARVHPLDKVQWMNLAEKVMTESEHFFKTETKMTPADYLRDLKKNIYSGKIDKTIIGFLINKKFYTLKFKEQFSSRLDFDQIPVEDLNDILMDQAYVLGTIHGNTLESKVDDYIKALATIPAALVDEKAVELKYKLKDQFNE